MESESFDFRAPFTQGILALCCMALFSEYFAPIFAALAVWCAARDLRARGQKMKIGFVGVGMGAYLVYLTVHLLWANPFWLSLGTVAMWWVMLGAYLALFNLLSGGRRVETALVAFTLVAGMQGALAVAQYAGNALLSVSIPLQLWDFVDAKVYALFPFRVNLNSLGVRAAATFSNPNLFAEYLVMLCPFSAAYAFTGERCPAKIACRISLLGMVAGLFFTFSRAGYLALFAVAAVLCIANLRRMGPILIVVFSCVLLIPDSIYERLLSVGNAGDVAIAERFNVWGIAMEKIISRPLFGYGAGVGAMWDTLAANGLNAPHAHNLFLQVLSEGGLVLLVLLLMLFWRLFRAGFELVLGAPDARMYGAATIAFCAGVCVLGMFDYPLFLPKCIGTFLMLLGAADAIACLSVPKERLPLSRLIPFLDSIRERRAKKRLAPVHGQKQGG